MTAHRDMLPTGGTMSADEKLGTTAERWLTGIEGADRYAAQTKRRYREIVEKYIRPRVGDLHLREVQTGPVGAFLRDVETDHGAATAKLCRTVLVGVLQIAVDHGALQQNPAKAVSIPKTGRREVVSLNPRQAHGLLSSLPPGDVRDALMVMLGTGARIGSVLALRWADVDLEAGTLVLTGTVVRSSAGLERQEHTKTHQTPRYRLPGALVDVLRARWESRGSDDLMFPNARGGLMDPHNFRKTWRTQMKTAGFEWVTPHVARKSVATLLARRLGDEAARDQLGHDSVATTRAHYVESVEDVPDHTDVLGEFLTL
ncbi:hypothetical protein GCM10011374_03160 [Kocuria dechangensis]|uniref:Tyr recombinase domain-containing protein n=2 Tax=Kocuria dechangensis TaxID=1176249 RepID=A0A917GGM2_9MICC|nr:hypothetical protein GCM10011374_03160 [Kocuria dechangensis]